MAVRTHADMMLYSATKLTMYTGGRITGSGTGDEREDRPIVGGNLIEEPGQTAVEITFHVSKPRRRSNLRRPPIPSFRAGCGNEV